MQFDPFLSSIIYKCIHMKSWLTSLFIFTIYFISAQPATDYAVQTWAEVDDDPAKITVHWLPVDGASNYFIYRKMKNEGNWGPLLETLDASVTSYEDTNITIGNSYEYKIQKNGNVQGFGYINTGINVPPVHHRGNLLLLVDDTFSTSLEMEILQLMFDFAGDGWNVVKQNVDRDDAATNIKAMIIDIHANTPSGLDAIYCLGHVPVPYSGNYAPDGHTNNHEGAWPTDGYYAEINGFWTDNSVNNTTASQERTHNIPNDGKFDQSFFPSNLEFQIGRVDFANMPAFEESEEELLRQYLNKSHAYKIGNIKAEMKAVIDDNFGGFNGEAFSASGWKNFAPLLNPENVYAGDYRTSMDTTSFIWSYGCGGGSYTSCSGVGTTTNFASDSLQGIFSCLFGSYFGDWDATNNLLRASIAQGTTLTNCWSGRPHWYFHHMGLGENIGYSGLVSMNNNGVVYNTPLTFLSKIVGMGIMGDPTLRMHIVSPPSNVIANYNGNDVEVAWTQAAEADAYYVYRTKRLDEPFKLLNEDAIIGTSYIDECIDESGTWYYMVRGTKLETTPGGSYHNLSQGSFAFPLDIFIQSPEASFITEVSEDLLSTTNNSTNATAWLWSFGDGNSSNDFEPTHVYATSGEYDVSLIAFSSCFSDTLQTNVSISITNSEDITYNDAINISPNPTNGMVHLRTEISNTLLQVIIVNSLGQQVDRIEWDTQEVVQYSMEHLPKGLYFFKLNGNDFQRTIPIQKIE